MTIANTSFSINKASNGFIVERSWTEKFDNQEFSNYQNEKSIFTNWADVVTFISNNTL
jgi:hypothetical protein